jgi:ATP-binding cassette, subfamily F, member 3
LRARRTQLKREQDNAIERPVMERRSMDLDFRTDASRAHIALRIKGYRKELGGKTLFDNAGFTITCGERVALAGLNGSGKTTLLRDIVQNGNWENPVIQVGPSLRIGYCAQEQEILNPESTLIEEVMRTIPMSRSEATAILLKFLFPWDQHSKRVADLSGGERNRLQLARIMLLKPNFLILDEPTNHLDIPAREAVEEALSDLDCTLLVVSHDRYFLDKIAGRVVEISDGALVSYPGNFTEYWIAKKRIPQKTSGRIQSRRKERTQTIRSRSNGELAVLESRIGNLEQEIAELENHIADAFGKRDHQEGRRAGLALKKVHGQLEELYEKWIVLSEN